jgi:hypothetical protein
VFSKVQEHLAKTVTTVSAEALAKAELMTFIVRVMVRFILIELATCHDNFRKRDTCSVLYKVK